MTKPTVIETRKVSKTYDVNAAPVTALVDVSFAAEENSFVSLVGPSGCGKSTLLQILAGLLPSSSGEVLVDGMPVRKPMPDKIAVVFQDATLLPWKTVIQNVEFPLEVRSVPPRERRECARAMLAQEQDHLLDHAQPDRGTVPVGHGAGDESAAGPHRRRDRGRPAAPAHLCHDRQPGIWRGPQPHLGADRRRRAPGEGRTM